jgi:hypothetical protein
LRKFIIIALILLYSNIHSQWSYFGAKFQAAFNTHGAGVGAGIHFTGHIDSTSSFRLLLEYSTVTIGSGISDNRPIVRAASYELLQFKAVYFYYFPERKYHIGAGLGYFTYSLGPGSSGMSDVGEHISIQELDDTIGFDLIIGATLSELISAELNYVFSFPELSSRVIPLDIIAEPYTRTQTVNMNTIYLNLVFSISTLVL